MRHRHVDRSRIEGRSGIEQRLLQVGMRSRAGILCGTGVEQGAEGPVDGGRRCAWVLTDVGTTESRATLRRPSGASRRCLPDTRAI